MNQLAESSHSVIVECPTCHVQFWVDEQLLSAMEEPCFHCSKCDHIFRQEAMPQEVGYSSDGEKEEEELYDSPEVPQAELQPAAIDDLIEAVEQETLVEPEEPELVEESFDEEFVDFEEEEAWSVLADEQEDSSLLGVPSVVAEQEGQEESSEERESPHFEASIERVVQEVQPSSHETIQEAFDFVESGGDEPESTVLSDRDTQSFKEFFEEDPEAELEDEQSIADESDFVDLTAKASSDPFEPDAPLESFRADDFEEEALLATETITDLAARQEELDLDDTVVRPHQSAEVVELDFGESSEEDEQDALFDSNVLVDLPHGHPQPRSSYSHVLMYVGGPLLLFLVLLGLAGNFLGTSSPSATQYASMLFAPEYRAAPPEVRLVRTKFKKIELDSGDSVYAIMGKLKNDSVHTLNDVLLEGVVFDPDGQALSSKKVSLSPVMNKELSSLTPEVIERLQNTPPRKLMLRPREKKQFAIVFMPDELASAEFFTARVFSVKY